MANKYNFIYKTTNLINNKFYIGKHSTNDLNDNYLGSGTALNRAIKKYGRKNFKREILEFCIIGKIKEKEEFWIKKLNAIEKGYNIVENSGGGYINKETYEMMSKKFKGRKLSDEVKKKIGDSNRGKNNYLFGKNLSQEVKDKISKSNKGKIRSIKLRKRISETLITKINIGEIKPPMLGKKHSEFSKLKNRNSHLGKKLSEETKKKMSESRSGCKNHRFGKKFRHSDKTLKEMRKIVCCPHCGKNGMVIGMARWHFNNCKFKK